MANPATLAVEVEAVARACVAVDACLKRAAAEPSAGPWFLGHEPSIAEGYVAPHALRMLAALPALRYVELPKVFLSFSAVRAI